MNRAKGRRIYHVLCDKTARFRYYKRVCGKDFWRRNVLLQMAFHLAACISILFGAVVLVPAVCHRAFNRASLVERMQKSE